MNNILLVIRPKFDWYGSKNRLKIFASHKLIIINDTFLYNHNYTSSHRTHYKLEFELYNDAFMVWILKPGKVFIEGAFRSSPAASSSIHSTVMQNSISLYMFFLHPYMCSKTDLLEFDRLLMKLTMQILIKYSQCSIKDETVSHMKQWIIYLSFLSSKCILLLEQICNICNLRWLISTDP